MAELEAINRIWVTAPYEREMIFIFFVDQYNINASASIVPGMSVIVTDLTYYMIHWCRVGKELTEFRSFRFNDVCADEFFVHIRIMAVDFLYATALFFLKGRHTVHSLN